MLLPEQLNDLGQPAELSIIRNLHGFEFAPLVCEKVALVAELQVQMLWPQAPGAIVSAGGDIDNRLKTLFDSLKMPSEATALPKGTSPFPDERPFYCLLEDDRLITRVDVETDRLLDVVGEDVVHRNAASRLAGGTKPKAVWRRSKL